jgi:hypothetical protein
LLLIPPSENQQRDGAGTCRVQSTANSGTALIKPGKLRLILAATTTGIIAGDGRWRSGTS